MILTREDVSYSRIDNPYRPDSPDPHSYVAAARIYTSKKSSFLVVNVYSPPARWMAGQGTQEQTFQPEGILTDPNIIVAGDFNAHSHVWDPYQREDAQGHRIEDWALTAGLSCINDGTPTRFNPATGGNLYLMSHWCQPDSLLAQRGPLLQIWGPTTSPSRLPSRPLRTSQQDVGAEDWLSGRRSGRKTNKYWTSECRSGPRTPTNTQSHNWNAG